MILRAEPSSWENKNNDIKRIFSVNVVYSITIILLKLYCLKQEPTAARLIKKIYI